MEQEFLKILETSATIKDDDINLVQCALAMAAIQNPVQSIERFQNHINKMIEDVASRHEELIEKGAENNAATQLAALKHIIVDKHDYRGDSEHYDDI